MDKIPFSVYDFFSYLFAGFLLLIGLDYAFRLGWLVGQELNSVQIAFWVAASYVVGQLNSHWASWLIENKILNLIGKPETHLFVENVRRPFKHFRQPLPVVTAKAIREKYERMSTNPGSERDLFIYCFSSVKEQCPQAFLRLNTFLNLYGFSRNLCFALTIVACALAMGAILEPRPKLWLQAACCEVASITFFFRYLKFYRLYSYEVFTSFLTNVKD